MSDKGVLRSESGRRGATKAGAGGNEGRRRGSNTL